MSMLPEVKQGVRPWAGRGSLLAAVFLVSVTIALMLSGCADKTTTTSLGGAAGATSTTSAAVTLPPATTASLGVATIADTGPIPGPAAPSPAEAVAAECGRLVVNVTVTGVTTTPYFGNQPYEGVGSGIVISSDGYIVTNDHVVMQNGQVAQTIKVTFTNGEKTQGTVVGADPKTDIAVIKVSKTGLPVASFAPLSSVKVGQYSVAIGSPLDFSNSVDLGIVSGLNRTLPQATPAGTDYVNLIQTDAPISPGDSGGGLFDATGRVVGMNVAYLPPSQTGAVAIGFAIPAETVLKVAGQLMAKK